MALRSTNLMIGDWVMVAHGGNATHHAKVTALLPSGAIECELDGCGVLCRSVEPIPITPEILKDNGWKDISDHTLKGCNTFRLRIEQGPFDYALTLKPGDYFMLDSYDDRVYTLCGVYFGFKYVHELQHALRLCGIEKEIVL